MASRVIKDKVKSKGKDNVKAIDKLNDKQKQFCIEYIVDLNGLQAYKRAYGEDLDDNTCKVNGCRLLTNANVKQYINDVVDSYTKNVGVTVGEVVSNIKTIAFNPNSRDSDRIKASELLSKYLGILVEKKDITSNGSSITVTLED